MQKEKLCWVTNRNYFRVLFSSSKLHKYINTQKNLINELFKYFIKRKNVYLMETIEYSCLC